MVVALISAAVYQERSPKVLKEVSTGAGWTKSRWYLILKNA